MVVRFDTNAQEQRASQVLARFSQEVQVGDVVVGPGEYRLLIVTASNSRHLVYFFFRDDQMPQDALNALVAETSPLESGKPWTIRLQHNAKDIWFAAGINTDTQQLHFRFDPLGTEKVYAH